MIPPGFGVNAGTGYAYRVVGKCDGCQLCEFLAFNNFGRVKGTNRYQVYKQPEGWEELEQCQEAFERCPYHGIRREEMSPGGATYSV